MKVWVEVPEFWRIRGKADRAKHYFPYSSISSSFCRTNLPKSVRTWALDPRGLSKITVAVTKLRSYSSFKRLLRVLGSRTIFFRSSHLFGFWRAYINSNVFDLERTLITSSFVGILARLTLEVYNLNLEFFPILLGKIANYLS